MMTERMSARLVNPQQAKAWLDAAYIKLKAALIAEHVFAVEIKPETRSTAQNRLLWSALNDVSRQVVWHGLKLSPDDWKDMATAALKKSRVVPGLDGSSFVVLGQRTSQMTRGEMAELIDYIHAIGAQHDVQFRPQSLGREAFTD